MKRLFKKAAHDWNNRDMAIVYVDGEVYEDATHAICLQRYFQDNDMNDYKVYLGSRPQFEFFKDLSEDNNGQDVILAHRVDKAGAIYFIYGLNDGRQLSDSEIKSDLEKIYPDYEIINDLAHDGNNHGYDEREQINKGVDRMNKFRTGELGEAIELFNYTMTDNGFYTNGYAFIDIIGDKNFAVRTVPITTIKGKETDGHEAFNVADAYTILGRVEEMCGILIDDLAEAGFTMINNDVNIAADYIVFERKIESTGEIIKINVDTKMYLDLDEISRDSQVPFNDANYKTGQVIDINDLPKIVEICNKVINFDNVDSMDFDEELEDFDFDFDFDDDNNLASLKGNKKIGRLRKKSVFVDSKIVQNVETNLFKDPTSEEIEKARNDGKGSIRGAIIDNILYVWNGMAYHFPTGEAFGLDMINNCFRFASVGNGAKWIFDCADQRSLSEAIDLINQHSSILNSISSLNSRIEIFNPTEDLSTFNSEGCLKIQKFNNAIVFKDLNQANNYISDRGNIAFLHSKRLVKQGSLPTLTDFYPEYYNEYEFKNIGVKDVKVSDIIGGNINRANDYNADWTPINENDERWIYQKELIENGGTFEPVDLIKMPNGKYVVSSDGHHRTSVAHVLGLDTIPANVSVMVPFSDNEDPLQQEKDKYAELKKEYKKVRKQYDELYEETYFSDDEIDGNKEKELEKLSLQLDQINDEMDKLEKSIMQKELENNQEYE